MFPSRFLNHTSLGIIILQLLYLLFYAVFPARSFQGIPIQMLQDLMDTIFNTPGTLRLLGWSYAFLAVVHGMGMAPIYRSGCESNGSALLMLHLNNLCTILTVAFICLPGPWWIYNIPYVGIVIWWHYRERKENKPMQDIPNSAGQEQAQT